MRVRFALLLLLSTGLLLACGSGVENEGTGAAPATPIAGRYEVNGVTVNTATGDKRELSGTVILAEDGETYTATFDFVTTYPGAEEALPAQVIGKGEGTIERDGTVQVEIENEPAQGEDYAPTRTTLRGVRVASATTPAAP